MTRIRATCPDCGEVDITAEDIELFIAGELEGGKYCFECPNCINQVSKPADSRIIQLLISGGVRASAQEPRMAHNDLPPLSYDDLLAFHFELEKANTLADLT